MPTHSYCFYAEICVLLIDPGESEDLMQSEIGLGGVNMLPFLEETLRSMKA